MIFLMRFCLESLKVILLLHCATHIKHWLIEVHHVSSEIELLVNPHYEIKGKDSGFKGNNNSILETLTT